MAMCHAHICIIFGNIFNVGAILEFNCFIQEQTTTRIQTFKTGISYFVIFFNTKSMISHEDISILYVFSESH